MNNNCFKSIAASILLLPLIVFFVSCSGDDYLNAIPGNSTALVSIDAGKYVQESGNASVPAAITGLLGIDDLQDCGLDISSRIYLFETSDGNIGLAAKVESDGDLAKWLSGQAGKGRCTALTEADGYRFTVFKDSWVAGFSSETLVILGPVLPSAQAVVRRQIVQYLSQDEEDGIMSSPMKERLDSIDAPIALVAEASALPEKFVAPFMLGAPKNADASQVMLAAGLSAGAKGCLVIRGTTFSTDKGIDAALKKSRSVFRPISGDYLGSMSSTSAVSFLVNVKGSDFLPLLHENKTFQALLAGMNMAVDMDNIIKSIDGDMSVTIENTGGTQPGLLMQAQLGSKSFLDDIDYWKRSCPAGTSITDLGTDEYRYNGGDYTFAFGVRDGLRFYASTLPAGYGRDSELSGWSLPSAVDSLVMGRRLAIVVNVGAAAVASEAAGSYLKALAGNTQTVVFIME